MSIDLDNSFEISDEGLAVLNEDGDLLFYLASGDGVPYGTSQENTLYFDQSTKKFWKSFGSATNEWVEMDIGPKINTIWSLGNMPDDPECTSLIDCGELPLDYFRSVIDLGEI